MPLSRRVRTYLTLGVIVAVLAIGGLVTFFVMNRFFQPGQTTEIRGRASVGAAGTATVTLKTGSNTRYVKDEFPVDIVLNTGNTAVSAVALGLNYVSAGTTPDLEVVDTDTTRSGIQIQSKVLQNMPGCADQINEVSREASGERRVFIDFGATCASGAGYNSNGEVVIATIVFRANAAAERIIQHDPTKAIVTRKSDGNDTLNAIPSITIKISADAQPPVVQFTTNTLTTQADGKLATKSANVNFNWKGTENPQRAADTVGLANAVEFQYRFDAAGWPAAWTTDTSVTASLTHNITTGHTIYVRGRDKIGNISTEISQNFLVDLTPTITSIVPTHAAGGQQITIHGFNFGSTKYLVYFGTAYVQTTSLPLWTDETIVAIVPATANGGTVHVLPSGRPASNKVSFALDTNLKIVMNLQGIAQDRGVKKLAVTVTRVNYEQKFTNLDATWNGTENAYVVVTPPLTDNANLITAYYSVSVKETSRLRRLFTNVYLTRGSQNAVSKKAATDLMLVGDVNGDNKITILDFSDMVKEGNFVGLSNAIKDTTRKYDLNGDNFLTAADISLLLTNYTKLETPGDAEK